MDKAIADEKMMERKGAGTKSEEQSKLFKM